MSKWTAEEVKEKLRGRHPATQTLNTRTIPGPWTTIEEWMGIDLLALCATSSPHTGQLCGVPYPRVGYEVKVSRSDYRSELKNPHKRVAGRSACHEFYFAVPKGLLKDHEMDPAAEQMAENKRMLWIPEDVGLIVVDGRGCKVVKASPVVKEPQSIIGYGGRPEVALHALVRWVSARPDARHAGVIERARAHARETRRAIRRGRQRDREALQALAESA